MKTPNLNFEWEHCIKHVKFLCLIQVNNIIFANQSINQLLDIDRSVPDDIEL